MATTTRGTAILKFGTYTVAGYIVNDGEISITGQKVLIDDETGQNVTHISDFGLEGTITLNFIPLSATTTPPANDAVITYNSRTAVVSNVTRVTAKRQPEIWRITADFLPAITYTT